MPRISNDGWGKADGAVELDDHSLIAGTCCLNDFLDPGILTLLPRLQADNVGLVSIYNNNGKAYLQFWRSVFERRAPAGLAHIEESIMPIQQKKTIREVSDTLLEALTQAYKEAAGRPLAIEHVGG